MRTSFALVLLAVILFAPLSAKAESGVGASYARARQSGGPFDGTGTGYKIFLGSYGPIVGGEVAFVDFGKLGGDGPRAQAWASALTVGYPISYLTPYGKAGLAFSRVKGTSFTEEAKHYRFFYGLGLRLGGTQGLGFRVEYERYRLDSDHLDLISAGLEYRY